MPEMTEEQAFRAMEILAKLYAEQYGFKNPQITITKKDTEKKESKKSEFLGDEMGL